MVVSESAICAIPLIDDNYIAYVSIEDRDLLGYDWTLANGRYAAHSFYDGDEVRIDGTTLMHRIVLDRMVWEREHRHLKPFEWTHWKDNNRLNNIRSNLEVGSVHLAIQRQKPRSKFKLKGVKQEGANSYGAGYTYLDKETGKNRYEYLGTYPDPLSAAYAYNQRVYEVLGERARLNDIPEGFVPSPRLKRGDQQAPRTQIKTPKQQAKECAALILETSYDDEILQKQFDTFKYPEKVRAEFLTLIERLKKGGSY